jgi:hypothetical protein
MSDDEGNPPPYDQGQGENAEPKQEHEHAPINIKVRPV